MTLINHPALSETFKVVYVEPQDDEEADDYWQRRQPYRVVGSHSGEIFSSYGKKWADQKCEFMNTSVSQQKPA